VSTRQFGRWHGCEQGVDVGFGDVQPAEGVAGAFGELVSKGFDGQAQTQVEAEQSRP
jgi:hypothetical protein